MTIKDSKREKRLNDVKALLDIFALRHQDSRQKRLIKAEKFISDFKSLRRSLINVRDPELNVFDILGFGNNEVELSSMLAWLMDEHESHYHGNLFLKTFVNLLALPLHTEMLSEYRVLTEHGGKEAIIDIMVYKKPDFLLYIENKVLSAEGDDQTPREFRDMRRIGLSLGIPESRQFAIFLTPDGRPPKDQDHWHSLSLNVLSGAYVKIGEHIRSPKLNFLLGDLHETTTRWSQ